MVPGSTAWVVVEATVVGAAVSVAGVAAEEQAAKADRIARRPTI
jgi:hypothetical protein